MHVTYRSFNVVVRMHVCVCVCVHIELGRYCTLAFCRLVCRVCSCAHVYPVCGSCGSTMTKKRQSCYRQVVAKIAVGQIPKIAMNARRAREAALDSDMLKLKLVQDS